jgi:hypothetical protein
MLQCVAPSLAGAAAEPQPPVVLGGQPVDPASPLLQTFNNLLRHADPEVQRALRGGEVSSTLVTNANSGVRYRILYPMVFSGFPPANMHPPYYDGTWEHVPAKGGLDPNLFNNYMNGWTVDPADLQKNQLGRVTWNTNCYVYAFKGAKAISVSKEGEGSGDTPATLLTRRHVYLRGHSSGNNTGQFEFEYPTPTNFVFWFLGTNNVPVRCVAQRLLVCAGAYTPIKTNGVGSYAKTPWQRGGDTNLMPFVTTNISLMADYTIAFLSNDVPDFVEAMCLVTNLDRQAPAYWTNSIKTAASWTAYGVNSTNWTAVNFCQHRVVCGSYFPSAPWLGRGTNAYALIASPFCFVHQIQGGDSGSPRCVAYRDQLFMLNGASTSGWSPLLQHTVDRLTTEAGLSPRDPRYRLSVTNLQVDP